MTRKYIESKQDCGHTRLWVGTSRAPRIGDRIYCTDCADMRTVSMVPGSWAVVCEDCRWKRVRVRLDSIRTLVVEHLQQYDHLIHLMDYNQTQKWTIRAQVWIQDGTHTATTPQKAPPSRHNDPQQPLF